MGKGTPHSPLKKQRDSQIELLRIIAMSMILIHHFVVHGSGYSLWNNGLGFQNSFIIYGVDLFILITGYYGINIRWKTFLALTLTVVFFLSVEILALNCYGAVSGSHRGLSGIADLFRVFKNPYGQWWFVSCYITLFIFAPILNLGLRAASKSQLRGAALICFVYAVYAGMTNDYVWGAGRGLSVFMLMYIIGWWIRVDKPFQNLSIIALVIIFIGCSIVNGMCWNLSGGLGKAYSFSYLNIFCLIGSISVFLIFTRLSFRNRIINSIATASFGCYLLQEGIGSNIIYTIQLDYCSNHSYESSIVMFVVSFVALWVVSWVLTWFKNLWVPKLIDAIYRWLPQRFKQEVW